MKIVKSNSWFALSLTAAGLFLSSSCASYATVAYKPQTAKVVNATEDFERIVLTARAWRPSKVEVSETFANLIYTGQYGLQTVAIPFDEIAKVELLKNESSEEYDVDLLDSAGERLFRHLASSRQKAEQFVDAMTVLVDQSSTRK